MYVYVCIKKSLFYDLFRIHKEAESANKPFFYLIQFITQTTVIEYVI